MLWRSAQFQWEYLMYSSGNKAYAYKHNCYSIPTASFIIPEMLPAG